jgi:hypothetical protein
MLAIQESNEQSVLVAIIAALPTRRPNTGAAAECRDAQPGIFCQRQQSTRLAIRIRLEDGVLSKRRAGLLDVQVNTDLG